MDKIRNDIYHQYPESRYPSPVPLGSKNLTATIVVDECYFDDIGRFTTSATGNKWYRIRSKGTAPLAGFSRTGMDDALVADGEKHFAALGSTEMQDVTARGKGDSLLRKIDFRYDHFVATYGPKGDGLNKKQVPATDAPSISRRIEQFVKPVGGSSGTATAAVKAATSFYGPGAGGYLDSYDSRNGPYDRTAKDHIPAFGVDKKDDPIYQSSHQGSVQINSGVATIMGDIYGSLSTNGGTATKKTTLVTEGIDNTVPFTLEDYHLPEALSARMPEIAGNGDAQLPSSGSVTTDKTLTPSKAGTPDTPVYYRVTEIDNAVLTVNAMKNPNYPTDPLATPTLPTYVALRVTGDFQGNKGGITVNPNVHLQVYFESKIDVKAANLKNNTITVPIAGNLQFYGISPPRDANGVPTHKQEVNLGSDKNTTVAMTFYAPSADVDIAGNPDFIGSMVCNTLRMNGGITWHYDLALNTLNNAGGVPADYEITSYVEDTR